MKCLKGKSLRGLVAVVALLLGSMLYAQPPGGGQRGGGQQGPPEPPTDKEIVEMVSDLAKEILLSEEQEEQVLEVYQAHFEDVEDELSGGGRPDRTKMEALEAKLQESVEELLIDDQIELYEQYLKDNEKSNERPSR